MKGTRLLTVLLEDDQPIVPAGLRAMLVPVTIAIGIGEAFYGLAALDAIDSLLP